MSARPRNDNPPGGPGRARREEGGFAMIAAILVTMLVTGLASAALLLSQMDVSVAGNYKAQRVGEVADDGGLELIKAMIYGRDALVTLPLAVPAATYTTWSQTVTYPVSAAADKDIALSIVLRYKLEDNLNFNTTETYPDEVVRYGKDYNYQQAPRATGRQPVYAATITDTKTGTKIQADLVAGIGFRTPAALFAVGVVHAQNYQWVTEETIEMTSGIGTPALATSMTSPNTGFTIEQVRETTTTPSGGATSGNVDYCDSSGNTNYAISPAYPSPEPNPPTPTTTNYLHQRVYRPAEVVAQRGAGRYNIAREMAHLLFGSGNRFADLDAAYTAAGGGAAGRAAADNLFRFYVHCDDGCTNANCASVYPTIAAGYDNPIAFDNSTSPGTCTGIVCYNFGMPAAAAPATSFEVMLGTTFADLASLADRTIPDTTSTPTSLQIPCTDSGTISMISYTNACNLSGKVLGTADEPAVVYFTNAATTLITTPGTQFSGFGVLIFNGNAEIIGSINWTGLMIIKGNLVFRPAQGGTASVRSGPELATRWNGYIMIGGNLDLWTYFGGSIILGYDTDEIENINDIVAKSIPKKTLTWRREYN